MINGKELVRSLRIAGKVVLSAMLLSSAANANRLAADMSRYPGAQPQLSQGVAAQFRLYVPIGGKGDNRTSDNLRLAFEAGPQFVLSRSNGETRRALAPIMNFSYRPQKSAQMSVAGQQLYIIRTTPLSYSERESLGRNKTKIGVSTAGWIGIGVGAAAAIGFYLMATGELSGPTD